MDTCGAGQVPLSRLMEESMQAVGCGNVKVSTHPQPSCGPGLLRKSPRTSNSVVLSTGSFTAASCPLAAASRSFLPLYVLPTCMTVASSVNKAMNAGTSCLVTASAYLAFWAAMALRTAAASSGLSFAQMVTARAAEAIHAHNGVNIRIGTPPPLVAELVGRPAPTRGATYPLGTEANVRPCPGQNRRLFSEREVRMMEPLWARCLDPGHGHIYSVLRFFSRSSHGDWRFRLGKGNQRGSQAGRSETHDPVMGLPQQIPVGHRFCHERMGGGGLPILPFTPQGTFFGRSGQKRVGKKYTHGEGCVYQAARYFLVFACPIAATMVLGGIVEVSSPSAQDREQLEGWLAAARQGSADALGGLLETCRNYLLLIANQQLDAQLRGKVGPSDLVQESFLEAQRDFGRFQGKTEEELLAWLRRILLNNLANISRHYRETEKRQIEREVRITETAGLETGLICPGESPSAALIAGEQDEALHRAFAQLPEPARQVILWRNYERLPFEEIGRRLERSAEAARKLWVRALEQLEELLGPLDASS